MIYALPPLHTLYKHIVAVIAAVDKHSPQAKLLLKSGVFRTYCKYCLPIEAPLQGPRSYFESGGGGGGGGAD